MKISVGPTGATVVGDVLDVNPATLERLAKNYDPLLYLKWNPLKRNGMGVWELRRAPAEKTVKEVLKYKGETYVVLDYVEKPLENHVWDLDHLGYDLLQRIKDSDQFVMCNYEAGQEHRISRHIAAMDDRAYQIKQDAKAKGRADMLYNLKQDKGILKDFQEKLLSGVDPNHLMRYWGK